MNITAILYMFFRLAPFMLVCFFSLYCIFNKNMNGIIYLAGLLIACFVTVLIGNFPGFQNIDKSTGLPSQMNQSCRMIEFTETGPISYLPLGQTILAYTFGYVGLPIIKDDFLNNNFNHVNIPVILFFFALLVADLVWNMYKKCFGVGSLVVSSLIGIVVGVAWVYSLMASGNNVSLFQTESTSKSCPKDTVYNKKRCRVRSTPFIYAINSDLNKPDSICTDTEGNLYISDTGNNIVRKITFGITETGESYIYTHSIIAGSMDLSTDPNTQLKAPTGICFDPNTQCIFVADSGKHVIRKIGPSGDVTIYAGKLNNAGYSGNGNLATSAHLNNPTGLYMDNNSNLFVCDTYNHVIRKIDSSGTITLFAGTPQKHNKPITDNEIFPTDSYLKSPSGVSGDKNGNIYIADTGNSRIRKVDIKTGKISTFNVTNSPPIRIAIDNNNNIYVIDDGKNLHYYPNENTNEIEVGHTASMNNICLDTTTNAIYYITNNTVQLTNITKSNSVLSFDVKPTSIYDTNLNTNTNRSTAVLNSPQDMCIDATGENIYITDTNNHVIRKMDSNGNISIFAGTFNAPTKVPQGSNQAKKTQDRNTYLSDSSVQDGVFRTQTTFNYPSGICCDNLGNIYVADTSNNVIRRIDSQGNVFTAAGSFDPTDTAKFTFNSPTSVGVDTTGNLYVIAATYSGNDSTTQIIQINKNGGSDIFASGTDVNFVNTKNTYNTANLMTDGAIKFDPLKKLFISPTNDIYVTSTTFVYKISNRQVSIYKNYKSSGILSNVFIDKKNNTYITDDTLKIINTNNTKTYNVKPTQNSFNYHSVFVDGVVNLNSYGTKSIDKTTVNNSPATNAIYNTLVSSCVDKKGNIYTLDAGNNIVYKIYDNTNTV